MSDTDNNKPLEEALKLSIENRAFEIELLWKRTTIFWGVIAALFVAVGYVKENVDEEFAFLLSLVGIVFSWIWTLANRGSKAWQESWEIKAAFLFNELYGKDTRTKDIFYRAEKKQEECYRKILNAQKFSLSRLLISLSDFSLICWMFMALKLFTFSFASFFSSIVVLMYVIYVFLSTKSTAPDWSGNKPSNKS